MTRASCSLAFSNSLTAVVARCVWVLSCTSARSTSMPATMPLCFRSSACWCSASRRLLLRARGVGARRRRQRLHEQVAGDEDDEVARAPERQPRGLDVVRLGPRVVERAEVEDRLRQEDARVEDVERSDDRRDVAERRAGAAAEAERREVDLLARLADAAVDVRQQLAERAPARALAPGRRSARRSARRGCARARAEIAETTVSFSTVGGQLARRHAAEEAAGRNRERLTTASVEWMKPADGGGAARLCADAGLARERPAASIRRGQVSDMDDGSYRNHLVYYAHVR